MKAESLPGCCKAMAAHSISAEDYKDLNTFRRVVRGSCQLNQIFVFTKKGDDKAFIKCLEDMNFTPIPTGTHNTMWINTHHQLGW